VQIVARTLKTAGPSGNEKGNSRPIEKRKGEGQRHKNLASILGKIVLKSAHSRSAKRNGTRRIIELGEAAWGEREEAASRKIQKRTGNTRTRKKNVSLGEEGRRARLAQKRKGGNVAPGYPPSKSGTAIFLQNKEREN